MILYFINNITPGHQPLLRRIHQEFPQFCVESADGLPLKNHEETGQTEDLSGYELPNLQQHHSVHQTEHKLPHHVHEKAEFPEI